MESYIYYDQHQKYFLEEILKNNEMLIPIEAFELIESEAAYVLILVAQPSLVMLEKLATHSDTIFFVRRGIRHTFKSAYIFDSGEDFDRIFKEWQFSYHEYLKDQYESKLIQERHMDENDREYLNHLKGKRTFSFKKKSEVKNFHWSSGLITICGSAMFATEFSKSISKNFKVKTIIIDGDLLKPSLDRHFKINNIYTKIESHIKGIDNTGFNIALDAITKGAHLKSALKAMVYKDNAYLDVLLGNYNLYNYEHYDDALMELLLLELIKIYDIVILNVDTMLYDSLTLLGLHLSQFNYFVTNEKEENLRYTKNLLSILESKQRLVSDKNKVIYERDKKSIKNINETVIKRLFKQHYAGNFLGQSLSRRELDCLMVSTQKRWD